MARPSRLRAGSLACGLLALLCGGFAPVPARADAGGYAISSFHVDLDVQADAGLLVQERLEVVFSEARHGLYRTIPVRYTDPRGFAYSLGFRLLEVVDAEGRAHGVKVSNHGRYVKLRLGRADHTVTGRVVYVIRYTIRRGPAHFAEHDELYWNATGNEWLVPIARASATVRLPGAVASADLQAIGYTGCFGSCEQAVEITRPGPAAATFTASRRLEPREGLTVVIGWPHGLVRFPGHLARTARWLADNLVALVPFLALGLLWHRYRGHGRDPEGRGTVVVRYEPPEGISAAEMGTLIDERVHLHDITAAVVDLGVRGFLSIQVQKKSQLFGLVENDDVVFERLPGRSHDDLQAFERAILDGLFAGGDRVHVDDLKEEFYRHIPDIRTKIHARLVSAGYFASDPRKVRARYVAYGLVAGVLTMGAGLLWALFLGVVMPQALIVPAVAAVLTAVVFFVFAAAMPRRTRKGVEMRAWGLGFQEFVNRVEKARIAASERAGVFEALLPYAMALGVASTWARKFDGIYMQGQAPAWYIGSQPGHGFSTRVLESSLSGAMRGAGAAMQAAPRSSGSSGLAAGGGFSGGGVGGGGGGSW